MISLTIFGLSWWLAFLFGLLVDILKKGLSVWLLELGFKRLRVLLFKKTDKDWIEFHNKILDVFHFRDHLITLTSLHFPRTIGNFRCFRGKFHWFSICVNISSSCKTRQFQQGISYYFCSHHFILASFLFRLRRDVDLTSVFQTGNTSVFYRADSWEIWCGDDASVNNRYLILKLSLENYD